MATHVVTLDDVSYWYPESVHAALHHVTWRLDPGLHVVAGDSGCGKSTLLRTLNGLVPHFHGGRIRGAVRVAGADVLSTPTRLMARRVGFVFQDPEMQSVAARVARDVAFGLANAGTPRAEMGERVASALGQAGLEGFEDRAVRTLSGGERQRLALASALVTRPEVVVLDEPLSQLDDAACAAVVAVCEALADAGITVVMAEHRLDLLPAEARVHLIEDGRHAATTKVAALSAISRRAPAPDTPGPVMWQLDSVTVAPGATTLLRDVCIAGRAGEVVALTGANGSGKTSLLRILAGLAAPSHGHVDVRGRIAYLPQNPGVLLHRETVQAEIETTLRHCGSADGAGTWLDLFGLGAVAGRYPRDLSSGQRQRAAIAATLAARPGIALLDEPTRGMDARARDQLITALDTLRRAGGAVVLATHDRNLTAALDATVVELRDGAARPVSPVAAGAAP